MAELRSEVTDAREFRGFPRPDDTVGTRNHVVVFPSDGIVNRVVDRVGSQVPGVTCIPHQVDLGGDQRAHLPVVKNFLASPNIFEAIVIGFGDGSDPFEQLVDSTRGAGGRVTPISVHQAGGVAPAVEEAVRAANAALARSEEQKRRPVPARELVFGTECGGSDAFSGLTANPAVGVCSDLVVADGGSAILAETTEMIGAEHLLRPQAIDDALGKRIERAIAAWEHFALEFGEDLSSDNIMPGNVAGGLTTIEEKSLGCIRKGGTSRIVDLVGFGERSEARGLRIMDTDGDDIGQLVALAAGGANVVAFTTGRGTPTASPIVPTIKIASNSEMANRLAPLIDLDAGVVVDQGRDLETVGAELFELVLEIASGRLTTAEERNQADFALPPLRATA